MKSPYTEWTLVKHPSSQLVRLRLFLTPPLVSLYRVIKFKAIR